MLSFMGRRPFVRQQVLEAAFDLIAREGYEAVTTRDIAAAAGVGSASMFRHFPSKEALGQALYQIALAPLLQAFADLEATATSPADGLRRCVHLLYESYDHRPRALALLIFPPHAFTPAACDTNNPASPRRVLQRVLDCDDDLLAIVWGAITGPLQDRYLRCRLGAMQPHAEQHAATVVRLLSATHSRE